MRGISYVPESTNGHSPALRAKNIRIPVIRARTESVNIPRLIKAVIVSHVCDEV